MIYEDTSSLCSEPLLSAFIFTYNQQELVKNTIESFLSQQCDFEYEIVICDDCSKDNTLKVCLEYQMQYPDLIRVVENDNNLGIRGNYITNVGKYARGKYVATCAGDDWWSDKKKLQKQVSFLVANPRYSLVHSYAAIYIDSKKKYSKRLLGSNRNSFEENILCNGVAALTICFTKKSFDEFVLEVNPLSLPFSEDYPMVIWFSYRKQIYFMNEVLCTYRLLTNSLSHSTDLSLTYKRTKEVLECQLLFINMFNYQNQDIINKVYLASYVDTIRMATLLDDKQQIAKACSFFKEHHYRLFYLLSRCYRFAGTNTLMNELVFMIERILRRVHPYRKFYL